MILRGFSIENWRCIRKLDLPELSAGIVVLHGPNRTGKSSIVSALRCGLFDSDHNTSAAEIKNSLPWSNSGAPKIIVEFTAGGVDYRLSKVFSKGKDGMALLEKRTNSQWSVEQDSPKEAARRAREILGADKSTGGLNQLLWLSQGTIKLPDSKTIDMSLQQQLVRVLGVMVTGRDFDFKRELDKRYARWFTATTGNIKKDSEVSRLENLREERQRACDDEKEKLSKWEDAIRRLQDAEDELPAKRRDVETAEKERQRLEEERQRGKERLQKFREAENDVAAKRDRLQEASTRIQNYRGAKERMRQAEAQHLAAQERFREAQGHRDRLVVEHDAKLNSLEASRLNEQRHLQNRIEIEDRAQLLRLEQRGSQLTPLLELIGNKEAEIGELEQGLKAALVPEEKLLQELRDNRKKADSLRAQLQASAIRVGVSINKPTAARIKIDGQSPAEIAPGAKATWAVQQHAEVEFADFGVVEISRAQESLDINKANHELAQLDLRFREAVTAFQENPADEVCLDRLAKKLFDKNSKMQRLIDARRERDKLAPKGLGTLEAELAGAAQQRQIILQRRPDIASWQPNQIDVDEGERQFNTASHDLATQRQACENAEKTAGQLLKAAVTSFGDQQKVAWSAATKAQSAGEELRRLGDETALQASFEQTQQSLQAAEQVLVQCRVTEEEKQVDQRLNEAGKSLEERKKRLRDLENTLLTLRTILEGNEGLHTRLADAEGALQAAEKSLAREQLEATAHKRLRDLFDECRESQVLQVMGPIGSRVLEWSQRIGLTEYKEVRFGDNFLPDGIVMQSSGPESAVQMDEESHGTCEQLSILVRLALGGVLSQKEKTVAILDDPLAHSDATKHRRILDILRLAAEGNVTGQPPAGPLQIIILTCHPERFDHLTIAQHIDLGKAIVR